MNKLFTKVAALTLGVAMAAGVGVALGSAKASEAKAIEVLSYTLTPASGSNNSYNANCDIAISGITWNLTGNSTMQPWRIGGKNLSGTDRELYSKTSLTDDISRIEVTHGAASGITINSWTLIVSTHDDFSSPVSTLTPTFAANGTTNISRPSGVSWAGCYYKFVYNVSVSGSSNKYLEFTQAKFYRESSNPRGTLEINEPEANVFAKGDKFQVSYSWTPASGSSATVASSAWSSSDSEVLSVENDVFTAVAPGYASVVLNATDSIGEEYEVISKRIYVSESYGFAIGDEVALISSDPKFELSSISDSSTKYGIGVAYTDVPAGTFALTVEAGSVASSFAFKNGTNYLSWTSGNSLNVATEKSEATSWFVVEYGTYTVITNCSDLSRELWWNNTKDQERFACYTSKTQETENFTSASLYKLGGEPEPELVSIAVSGEYKTKYGYQAEEFDKEGIVVTATYSDQSQQTVDLTDVEFSGFDKSVLGEQTVTVTYQEKTTTFKVTVYYTATYKPGEGTPEDGEYVEYIENPDNYELVSFEQTGFVAPEGKQFKEWSQGVTGKVVVSANGNLNFTAVYEDIPVAKYSVTYTAGQGTGDNYVVSDVEAGSSHALVTFETAAFTAPEGQQFKGWQVGNDAELRDAGYEVTVDGDLTVTAIYEDIPVPTDWSETFKTTFQSKFNSTVYPTFMVEFADDNNIYWNSSAAYCQMVASGNLLVNVANAFYADANWNYIGQSMVYSGEYAFENADEVNAYVYYASSQDVTVIVLTWVTSIKVDTTNAKTEYYVGDTLDLTNVYVHYELMDGDWFQGHVISSDYWTASPTTLDEAGDEITISIDVSGVYQLSYTVKVTPVVMESLSISGELSKTEYTEGDAWDVTGLVVTAHYNNGTEADVTDQVTWSFDPAETAVGVTSVSTVAQLGDLSSDAVVFDVTVEQGYNADTFAKDLLDLVAPICANYDGQKNNKAALKTVWDTMSQRYSTLSNEEKAKVIAAAAKADGTDLEKAMAFYNYACKKYGLTKFIEGRQVKALVTEHETGNSILPIVVIVASSVAAITAIGVVIALKRRKALLAK
ncbi:MAG: bacterial Ig-like domain-containing protein [Bacilli bacterium]|nr:bacterial Ig-like domain-containing protein [Bacilli bacterium]